MSNEPLLAAGRGEAVQAQAQAMVQCAGVAAQLSIERDGGILYTPCDEPAASRRCCSWSSRAHRQLRIPGEQVVGAALDGPTSFRVWSFCPQPQGNSQPPRFRLSRSLPFKVASHGEATSLVQAIRQAAVWREQGPRRVLAIINPSSGQGRSRKLFDTHVVPVLEDAAGLSLHIVPTEAAGHATQLCRELDLSSLDLLVFVGGDGTVYEGLQGLLGRPDWAAASRIPFCHVPGGSGNGLAHSCGLRDPATAAYAICKAAVSPLDVASVLQPGPGLQPPLTRRYAMLSVAFGSLANLDVNTEPLRWLGETRFLLGGLVEVLRAHKYSASMAWLPPAAQLAVGQPAGAPLPPPAAKPPRDGSAGRGEEQQLVSNGSAWLPPGSASTERLACISFADVPPGPELPLLQQWAAGLPLGVPREEGGLPPGWVAWHEPLQFWSCVGPEYISATARINPRGGLATGSMTMMWLTGLEGVWGRLQAVDFQSKVETGEHIHAPYLTQHEVRAMVFEPRDERTYLQLDGEVIPRRPLLLEVHPGLCRVIVNPAGV